MSKASVYLHFKEPKFSSRCYIYLDPYIQILVLFWPSDYNFLLELLNRKLECWTGEFAKEQG